nr:MAG TPA: hypothetical protein [Caudoviricetes sp.]
MGKSFGGILGKKKSKKNRASRPVIVSARNDPTHSTHGFPASAQSVDRARATGDKVQLNQCYCRATESLPGSADRSHGSNRPAPQTTDSRRRPASGSTDRRNSLPHSRRRRYGRSILFIWCIYQ